MEGSSKVKMPSKTRLATGKVVDQLKGARQERLLSETRGTHPDGGTRYLVNFMQV